MKKLIALFFLVLFFSCCNQDNSNKTDKVEESIYSKVLRTGKIRAAYTIYPPGCMKDENGKLIGVFVETLEKVAESLDLKVEWTEEVGWATQIEGLDKGRYDMIGSSVWTNPKRAKLASLSIPLYYSPIYIYAKKSNKSFDNLKNISLLNSPKVRIATIDGGTGEVIAKNQFPQAKRISLPELTDFSQSFLDVIHDKADILFMEPFHASKFLDNNPETIKTVDLNPLRTFGNSYMFKRNEKEFEDMVNVVLQDLINSNYVDDLLEKYEKYPKSYLRVEKPYILHDYK